MLLPSKNLAAVSFEATANVVALSRIDPGFVATRVSRRLPLIKRKFQDMLPADCFLWLATSVAVAPVVKIGWLSAIVYKIASLPVMIGIVFLTYWLLPNGKIPPLLVFVAALFVGLAMEAMKLLIWPWLYAKMKHEYGFFDHSVTILV